MAGRRAGPFAGADAGCRGADDACGDRCMQTPDLATRLFLGFQSSGWAAAGIRRGCRAMCHRCSLPVLRSCAWLWCCTVESLQSLLVMGFLLVLCFAALASVQCMIAVCEAAHRRGSGRPLVARTHAAVLMSTTPIGFRLGSTADRRHSCTRLMHSFGPAVRVPIARAVVSIIAVLCVASLANQARCGPQLREAQESSLHRYQVQAVPLRTPTAHVSLCAQRTRLQNRYR